MKQMLLLKLIANRNVASGKVRDMGHQISFMTATRQPLMVRHGIGYYRCLPLYRAAAFKRDFPPKEWIASQIFSPDTNRDSSIVAQTQVSEIKMVVVSIITRKLLAGQDNNNVQWSLSPLQASPAKITVTIISIVG